MAKNKAPQKKYKPKSIVLNSFQVVVDNNRLLCEYDPGYVNQIKLRDHSALASLIRGVITPKEMHMLAASFNLTLAMWKILKASGEVREWMVSVLARSGAAFNDLSKHGRESGYITVKAPEMQAMNDLIDLSDGLLDVVTVQQFNQAIKLAMQDCHKGKTLDQVLGLH